MEHAHAVLDIVHSTRELLLPHWGNIDGTLKEKATASSVVTELDIMIEQYLADRLAIIDPTIAFAGEECGGSRDAARFWLCDPIDGTLHFVRGMPFCSVMLALIEGGTVQFSAIYDFVHDVMYHAIRGEGAYQNAEPIHVSKRTLDYSFIAFETNVDRRENLELLQRIRSTATLFSSITSGFEFSLVASGKLDGRICVDPHGKDWDFAPGSLLVEEAGGIVANIGARTYDFRNRNFIAANKAVYRELTEGPHALFPLS